MALFFVAPFAIIVKISLSDTAIAMPPYVPLFKGFAEIGISYPSSTSRIISS